MATGRVVDAPPLPSPAREATSTSAATRRRALGGLPEPENPLSSSTDDARTLSAAMFVRLRELDEGSPEHAYVRNTLVELNLSLVKFGARRFRGRPEPVEDIVQVGTIGLIKAIDRFDPDRGVEFSAFALPTIVGEMKRFFRDTGWAVRVPRRLQELRIDLAKASDALEQRDGHRPDRAELAERLHLTPEEVAEGELAANGYTAHSLDAPVGDAESQAPQGTAGRRTAVDEPAYELIDDLSSLRPLLDRLCPRDRLILSLRFGEELTQAEIGRRIGLSQMHVSRLLARILGELRDGLLDDDATEDATAC
ncbi:SigB/SigF/SigG family RNA polymerase sigma factor [Streptomyces sp. R302]|uniref:SigB/SigF/SigG family RNA polymerase sigma factor n=1 Tax=unclassified Streptomyces TaxID=2593676 RepID=UPI00145D64DF|nr:MULTISPECIES: SigB/SigF/SigG family RNA polymerase sigma factor [unclassified Streptomyces]NML50648.1 SigB/SigF/SigG family RNA polymerase sigma factor [Streptomyces sp. R301]NML80743.1 SigB/SigF/SigG family RNA polymerase sigma factor [Streptomyces sp. R302]